MTADCAEAWPDTSNGSCRYHRHAADGGTLTMNSSKPMARGDTVSAAATGRPPTLPLVLRLCLRRLSSSGRGGWVFSVRHNGETGASHEYPLTRSKGRISRRASAETKPPAVAVVFDPGRAVLTMPLRSGTLVGTVRCRAERRCASYCQSCSWRWQSAVPCARRRALSRSSRSNAPPSSAAADVDRIGRRNRRRGPLSVRPY